MEGTFKGWLPNKSYGFISPDDGTPDIFVHTSAARNAREMRAGDRVAFDTVETEKGPNATNLYVTVSALTSQVSERRRGQVKFWNERGFGFIEPENGDNDIFVHVSEVARDEGGYLCDGYIVEYAETQGQKGPQASDVRVVGWKPASDHLSAFADLGGPGWLDKLAYELAEKEPWEYRHATAGEPIPVLRSYIKHTFRRLEEMNNGIGFSSDQQIAAFNTGLVTPNQEEIYGVFRRNPRPNRQPWKLQGFRKGSDWDVIEKFGSSPPPLANYFDDPSVLLYDRRCELFINIDHVMENLDRFPQHLQANPYVARQLLISAEATTKKRVYRNYKAAIPQYYRDKGGDGGVQLLLPICLENPAKADLALVVAKNDAGNAYRGSTVLTLDMAYNNARLLARPDTEWLQP